MLQTSKNHYEAELKGDKVIVGDPLSADFIPKVVLKRWGEECSIVLDVPEVAGKLKGGKDCSVKDGKVSWATPDIEFNFFEKSPDEQNDGGSFEYEIVLKKKPPVNSVSIPINLKGLVAYYQPIGFTPEEIARGSTAVRPDNVKGSYAFYHATRTNMHSSQVDADKYKCGKAFHIYRPKARDAFGKETWTNLNIADSILTITIPQDFLDTAVYPIIIDPDFGQTTLGGTSDTYSSDRIWGLTGQNPGASGTATSMSWGGYSTSGAHHFKCALYLSSDNSLLSPQTAEGLVTENETPQFWTVNFTNGPNITAQNYILAVFGECTGTCYYCYDTAGSHRESSLTYPNFPNPWTDYNSSSERISVYCTYSTAPAAPAFKLKMIPKRPWNRMSRLYKSLSLKGG